MIEADWDVLAVCITCHLATRVDLKVPGDLSARLGPAYFRLNSALGRPSGLTRRPERG